MDYGKVLESEIPVIDFKLPPDGAQTLKTLNGLTKAIKPELYVGASKWGRKDWLGVLFPVKTKEANFLFEYAKIFDSIELNAVFYSIPSADLVEKFRRKVENAGNTNFKFFPKISRTISHIKRLEDCVVPTQLFLENISRLGDMLGPCFLQMGDNFGPKNFLKLESYLKGLPTDQLFFCEVRHEEWFSNPIVRRQYFSMLAENRIGAVITDTAGRRDVAHMELSTPEVFIRFVAVGGNHLEVDFARIDDWVSRIKQWLDKGLQKAHFMINPIDELNTPELAWYAVDRFNKELNANLRPIRFIPPAEVTIAPPQPGF
ncbi:DUF72 domain-containing protein [Pedobacter panaciterrae]